MCWPVSCRVTRNNLDGEGNAATPQVDAAKTLRKRKDLVSDMKRSGMVKVAGVGLGLFALVGLMPGCGSDDDTGGSGDGRDELNPNGTVEQANGDADGQFGPLEKKPFGGSVSLSARKLMIA